MNSSLTLPLSLSLLAGLASGSTDEPKVPAPAPNQQDIKTYWTPPETEWVPAPEPRVPDYAPPKPELPPELRGAVRSYEDRLYFDRPGDGALWVRGANYKASFDASGATYIPFLGSDAPRNYPVSFELSSVTVGQDSLGFDRSALAELDGETVVFDRGGLVELYEMSLEGMEQMFVFEEPLGAGDLTVRVDVSTELAFRAPLAGIEAGAAPRDLRFGNTLGDVSYGAAFLVDADGVRTSLETRFTEGTIAIEVPAETLAGARYPITVDPIVTTVVVDASGEDDYNPDVAWEAGADRFLVIFDRTYSSTDHDIWAQEHLANGDLVSGSGAYIDYTSDDWRDPSVAANAASGQFLVVAERLEGTTAIWGRTRSALTGSMGSQFQISNSSTSGAKTNPVVGGDPNPNGPTFFLVVWERSYSSSDHDVHARMVTSGGALHGSQFYIDNSGGSFDRWPQVSKSNGSPPASLQDWNVVWQRQLSSSNSDLYGARIHWDGSLTNGSFAIDASAGTVDEYVLVSSCLDGDVAPRPYLVVSTWNGHVLTRLMEGTTMRNIIDLTQDEGVSVNQDHTSPSVDTDGDSFVVLYAEQYGTSTSDYDIYAATIQWDGVAQTVEEGHQLLIGTSKREIDTHLVAMRSGGETSRRFMGVWEKHHSSSDGDINGAIYEAPIVTLGDAYCFPLSNSTGEAADLSISGSASIAANDAVLTAFPVPNQPGLFFYGPLQNISLFGNGVLCVEGTIGRLDATNATNNTLSWNLDVTQPPTAGTMITAGSTWNFQAWFRDPAAGGSAFNLSDAVELTFLP